MPSRLWFRSSWNDIYLCVVVAGAFPHVSLMPRDQGIHGTARLAGQTPGTLGYISKAWFDPVRYSQMQNHLGLFIHQFYFLSCGQSEQRRVFRADLYLILFVVGVGAAEG